MRCERKKTCPSLARSFSSYKTSFKLWTVHPAVWRALHTPCCSAPPLRWPRPQPPKSQVDPAFAHFPARHKYPWWPCGMRRAVENPTMISRRCRGPHSCPARLVQAGPLDDAARAAVAAGQVRGNDHDDAAPVHRGIPQVAHASLHPGGMPSMSGLPACRGCSAPARPGGGSCHPSRSGGGRANAALEPVADRARLPAPTSPSSNPHPPGGMPRTHAPGSRHGDLINTAVVALHTTGFRLVISTPSCWHCSTAYSTRASCTRPRSACWSGQWGSQRAQLLHLQKARRFAEPVPH